MGSPLNVGNSPKLNQLKYRNIGSTFTCNVGISPKLNQLKHKNMRLPLNVSIMPKLKQLKYRNMQYFPEIKLVENHT